MRIGRSAGVAFVVAAVAAVPSAVVFHQPTAPTASPGVVGHVPWTAPSPTPLPPVEQVVVEQPAQLAPPVPQPQELPPVRQVDVPQYADQATRNAQVYAERPPLTGSISPDVQRQIDEANSLPPIDLGVLPTP